VDGCDLLVFSLESDESDVASEQDLSSVSQSLECVLVAGGDGLKAFEHGGLRGQFRLDRRVEFEQLDACRTLFVLALIQQWLDPPAPVGRSRRVQAARFGRVEVLSWIVLVGPSRSAA
jgi:hypothetical protein